MGLELSILLIWGLQVKGLQSYQPSNSENDSTPVELALASTLAAMAELADFWGNLQL